MGDDIGMKLKMLWLYGFSGFHEWRRDVWAREGRERMCCDGTMCGCYGADYYSWWEHLWETRHSRKPTP